MADLADRINRKRASAAGFGWLADYVCRLQHYYPRFTEEFVMDELSMIRGWIYFSFAYADDPAHKFCGVNAEHGYVFAEREKLMAQAKEFYEKQK